MPGICHNFGFIVYLLFASLSNPEFWYISLSLMMAHKAETGLAIDVLVSFNIIRHWFFNWANEFDIADFRLPTLIILLGYGKYMNGMYIQQISF